jgi:hypothetical protein
MGNAAALGGAVGFGFANEGAGRGCRGEVQGSISLCGDFLLILLLV